MMTPQPVFFDLLEKLAAEYHRALEEIERLHVERKGWLVAKSTTSRPSAEIHSDTSATLGEEPAAVAKAKPAETAGDIDAQVRVTSCDIDALAVSAERYSQASSGGPRSAVVVTSSPNPGVERVPSGGDHSVAPSTLVVGAGRTLDDIGNLVTMPTEIFRPMSPMTSPGDSTEYHTTGASPATSILQKGSRETDVAARRLECISTGNSNSFEVEAHGLELWPEWVLAPQVMRHRRNQSIMTQTTIISTFHVPAGVIRGGDKVTGRRCAACIIPPNATQKMVWDVLSVVALSYDVLTLPLMAFTANDDEESIFKEYADLVTLVFWMMDIAVQFVSGFHQGGFVEMRPSKIALRYVRSWFVPDLMVVLLDLVMLLIRSSLVAFVGIARITKILRVFRILRIFRLIRLMKWPAWAEDIKANLQTEALQTAFGAFTTVFSILAVNHFIACGWYLVGTSISDSHPSWVDVLKQEGRSNPYRYVTALHWSLSQFTPATVEIGPANFFERVYAIVIVLLALIIFSQFVSSVTTAMTHLRRVNSERAQERINIRRYIEENQITIELSARISAFLSARRFMARRRVHEEDIRIFRVLPEPLRLQVHWEVFRPRMVPHPFFHHLELADEECLLEVCHKAMGEESRATSQDLFNEGEEANFMFFSTSGVWEYFRSWTDSSPLELDSNDQALWFCEVVLWVRWEHRGRLSALTNCECVTVETSKFRAITSRRAHLHSMCQVYARAFCVIVSEALAEDELVEVMINFDGINEAAQQSFERAEEIQDGSQQLGHRHGRPFGRLMRSWSPGIFKGIQSAAQRWRLRAEP